jgi:hypothetical protein
MLSFLAILGLVGINKPIHSKLNYTQTNSVHYKKVSGLPEVYLIFTC